MSARGRQLLIALGLAVVLVGIAIAVSLGGSDDEPEREPAEIGDLFDGIPQMGTVLGDPDASLEVTEFGDMQCPFCADFAADAVPSIVEDYVRPGSLRLDFAVLAFLGPDSEGLARLVGAASLQDLAWPTIELLYQRQGAENSGYATEDFLAEAAADVPGLDAERALADRESPQVDRILRQAATEANRVGVSGTPSFFHSEGGEAPVPLDVGSLDAEGFADAIDPLVGAGG
jgi:protein-disulfide isomerase